jgi:hypothetical protein
MNFVQVQSITNVFGAHVTHSSLQFAQVAGHRYWIISGPYPTANLLRRYRERLSIPVSKNPNVSDIEEEKAVANT